MKLKQTFFGVVFLLVILMLSGFQRITISSEKEFQEAIQPLKEKLFIHSIAKIDNPNFTKKLIKELHNYAVRKSDSKKQIITDILLSRFYESQDDAIQVIVTVNKLLNQNAFYEEENAYKAMQSQIWAYNKTEQYNLLLDIYEQYYNHLKKFGIPSREASKFRRIANAHYKLLNYPAALKYFKEAEKSWESLNDVYMQSGANNDIGLCFLKMNKLDSARFYFNKTLNIIKEDYPNFKQIVNANLASILVKEAKYDDAIPFYKKELVAARKTKDIATKTQAYYKLANVYYLKHQQKIALKYIDSATAMFANYNNKNLKKELLFLKAKSLLKDNKVKKADSAYRVAERFKDSLEKERLAKEYLLATVKYETKKRELELLESQQKNKLFKIEKSYQKTGIFILVICLIASFFILQKVIKDKKRIAKERNKAEKISYEKEVLLQEVHHRVKNNLQVISSILELQSLQYDDEKFIESFQVGQNRIQAMSLIHQQLYSNDNLKDINFKEYVSNLIAYIKTANENKNKKIKFNLKLKDFTFPINTAVPLGLILNELISNAYKHAFVDKKEGEISIEVKRKSDNLFQLIIADNGVGIQKKKTSNTLGLKLVEILSAQIGGTSKYEIAEGTTFYVDFKNNTAV